MKFLDLLMFVSTQAILLLINYYFNRPGFKVIISGVLLSDKLKRGAI